MPVHNSDIAEIFSTVADLLDIEGANPFRIRAYRDAAATIGRLPRSVSDMLEAGGKLTEIQGIGKDLAGKITEIVETGALEQLEDLKKRVSPDLAQLMKIESLGPKRVRALHKKLGINTMEELKEAAEKDKIKELSGFGEKTQQDILKKIEEYDGRQERTTLIVVEQVITPLLEYIDQLECVKELQVAGSYRRRKETVGDLDILAISKKGKEVIDHFTRFEDVKEEISKGKTRSSVILRSGLRIDLRVLDRKSYGAAMLYFTGSKAHNIALRKMAQEEKKLKISEYGVFKGKKRVAGKTEEEVYDLLGVSYIPPELRENQGEIKAAKKNELPDLVELKDLKGDLHAHTKASDGHATIEEMARAAKKRGYKYLAITDHSPHVAVTRGLDAKRLSKQIDEIDRINDKLKGFQLLKGIEVDILKDGSLDLPDSILKKLDLVVGSIHSNFKMSVKKQTERIIKAMDNPYFNILGHPTGRMIGGRQPYELEMEKLMKAALERGCYLELNAQPDRLDLPDHYCRMAKDMGLKIAISTDAHHTSSLDYIRFGIWQARRGWIEKKDVINTMGWRSLKKLLKRS